MDDERLRLDFWTEKYAHGETRWDLGEVSAPVRRLVESHFPAQGTVLIPGCGRGYEALYLAARGYRVTAVDFAEAPLEELRAKTRRSGVVLEVLREDAFALGERYRARFDVLLEQTFLCAIDPVLRTDYEAMARAVLKPGGRLLGVFMEVEDDDGPPFSCPPGLLRELFPAEHWRIDWSEPMERDERRPGPEYISGLIRLP